MSKIAKLLAAKQKVPPEYGVMLPKMNFTKVSDSEAVSTIDRSTRYRIVIELGAEVWVSEETSKYPHALEHAIRDVRGAVVEEIFGEFRSLLKQVKVSLYDRDTDRAWELLEQLERQMFIEGT